MCPKIVIADCSWNATDLERRQFPADWIVEAHQCRTEAEVIEAAREADALLAEYAPVTRRVLESLTRCRIVSVASTGYDNVDAEAARELGIAVANVPNYCTEDVADHTLALMLAVSRQLPGYGAMVRQGRWELNCGRAPFRLSGKTLGLVGFGHIARAVARRAQGFGLQVVAHTGVPETVLQAEGVRRCTLDQLLAQADIISCHIPLTPETADTFTLPVFERMARRPLFINTSRGRVVDEHDLALALERGLISGAALDVLRSEPPEPGHPLLAFDNVLVTPHVGFYSAESLEALRIRSARNIRSFLEGDLEAVDLV